MVPRHANAPSRTTRWRRCLGVVAVALFSLGTAHSARIPRFEDSRVSAIYRGQVKPPEFGDPAQYSGSSDLRCFGGDPKEYTSEHPNFAGHFVIGACTCGSGCHYLFMWDARTGKFYRQFPVGPINVGPYESAATAPPGIVYEGEQYRIDSTLLIIEGCVEDTCDCATRSYNWVGSRFLLILKLPVRMPARCLK